MFLGVLVIFKFLSQNIIIFCAPDVTFLFFSFFFFSFTFFKKSIF